MTRHRTKVSHEIRAVAFERNARTLAISLQLRPASRIVFNRCSSSAVHGVFVRPFFLGVDSTGGGIEPGSPSIAPPAGFIDGAIMVDDPGMGEGGRLRDVDCDCCGCCCCCCWGIGAVGIGMPSNPCTRWWKG